MVKRVIVIFKTHLDIGYTDLAETVLKKYRSSFIPQAVDLAQKVNTQEKKRFVWTVGSYLIYHYLSSPDVSDENKEKLEKLLRLGWIRWHGLACTTHTELSDKALLDFNLSISKELDAKYAQKTIAAKMTDVPGHTIAIIPCFEEAGIEYLHIGVNSGSLMPEVPRLFVWRYLSSQKGLIVNYAGNYGEPSVIPALEDDEQVCLEFAHAGDNDGPPSEAFLDDLYNRLAEKYPDAEIEAGSLDDFALALRKVKDRLPVVEEEIGDTWIHGISSDPLKVAQYKTLLHLKDLWINERKLNGKAYESFMENLLLIVEHTWGSDSKRYLQDFCHWKKDEFNKARSADLVNEDTVSSYNRLLLASFGKHTEVFRREGKASYKKFEESHAEQRAYISKAVSALPLDLAAQARTEIEKVARAFPGGPEAALKKGVVAAPFVPITINGWTVIVGNAGEIRYIKKNNFERELCFCKFTYELFDGKAVDDNLFYYARDIKTNWTWFCPSFGKAGLRYESGIKAGNYASESVRLSVDSNSLYIIPKMPTFVSEEYGCPRDLVIEHCFEEDSIRTTLYLGRKDANRIPEALWLGMNFKVPNSNNWEMVKIGHAVSPLKIVRGGSRRLHCVEEIAYSGVDASIKVYPEHSPLCCLGEPCLYNTDDDFGSLDKGFHFLLFNNRWGTNFKQWFEDDLSLSFKTVISRSAAKQCQRKDER